MLPDQVAEEDEQDEQDPAPVVGDEYQDPRQKPAEDEPEHDGRGEKADDGCSPAELAALLVVLLEALADEISADERTREVKEVKKAVHGNLLLFP